MHDLVIQGGTVVSAAGRREADVAITGETIAALGEPGSLEAATVLDARGLIVTPGGVDPHVHLSFGADPMQDEDVEIDDFESGSRAALAGGVTCVGNMCFSEEGESLLEGIARDRGHIEALSHVDAFVHPVLWTPQTSTLRQVEEACEAGHPSLKLFMSQPTFDAHFATYARAMEAAKRAGGITLIHCEDASCVACCTQLLQGVDGTLAHYPHSSPLAAELSAVQRAIGLCELTECPTYIVHLSSEPALEACREARTKGLPLFVETRPVYLHLTDAVFGGPDSPLYTTQPPLRRQADVEALWTGLLDGSIDTLGSDHVGWSRASKLSPEHALGAPRPGVADLETMLPMLMSEGVRKRGLPLERFVALTSETPARLFGLHPQKGALTPGSDADVVVWDLEETRTVDGTQMQSRAGYSVYDGREVTGWPRWVVQRGSLWRQDDARPPGRGRLLARHGRN